MGLMPIAGYQIAQALVDALGIKLGHVERVVIDVAPDEVVRVYVRHLMSGDQGARLIDWCRRVQAAGGVEVVPCSALSVDEKGNVLHAVADTHPPAEAGPAP